VRELGRITFQLQNADGQAVRASTPLRLWLGRNNTTGRFFSDEQGRQPISTADFRFAQNSSTVTVYYQDTTVGVWTVRGSLEGFESASVAVRIND